MAGKEQNLNFIFEDPNTPKQTEEMLKRILLEKLLSKSVN